MIWSLLLACGAPAPEAPPAEAEHADHADHAHPHPHDDRQDDPSALGLSLDGTKRWQMDTHTREVMAKTRASIDSAEVADAAAGRALGDTLQAQLDDLIQGCTMEGPSHDELHVFLMKWIPVVSGLQKTEDDAEAKESVEALRSMLTEYERFFE